MGTDGGSENCADGQVRPNAAGAEVRSAAGTGAMPSWPAAAQGGVTVDAAPAVWWSWGAPGPVPLAGIARR
ncbi:hypothetical protein [Streptomyces sp. LMG1-1-1.1]|uniref:hypothetical protein n=1 Tax=Streptomyces sp. LMG1-1-1.1 TaxID=3135245 RepID=UPI003467028A